jgi:hypothetical protein
MKKYYFLTLLIGFFMLFEGTACQRGTGCPAADLGPPVNKKGELKRPKHHKKSGLFDKKMSKHIKKG